MRKILLPVFLIVLMVFFSSCGSQGAEQKVDNESISIVTTIFPEYDWVKAILGDNPANAEVTMLMDSGVDLHSFQPASEDMVTIANCDLFIYVGGESDEWVESALEEAANDDIVVLNLMDILENDVKEEELIEGMEAEEEQEGETEEGPEYDEHVWLSLKNAETICRAIEEKLAEIDPENTQTYEANLSDYEQQLESLDQRYQDVVAAAPVKTLLFGDRFPFRYMTEDYALDYYAAFVGCSAETEASFETIRFLAEKVDELDLSCVMTIEGSDQKIAETIVSSTKTQDQKILMLNSMQSITSDETDGDVSYISIMEDNLKVLEEAMQ